MSTTQELIERRERLLGPGNPLFYENPVHLVRGEGVWLFDADGNRVNAEQPQQIFTRWYGFSLTFPETEVVN